MHAVGELAVGTGVPETLAGGEAVALWRSTLASRWAGCAAGLGPGSAYEIVAIFVWLAGGITAGEGGAIGVCVRVRIGIGVSAVLTRIHWRVTTV